MEQSMTTLEFENRWKDKGSKARAHYAKYPYLADSYYEFSDYHVYEFTETMRAQLNIAKQECEGKRYNANLKDRIYAQHLNIALHEIGVITMSVYDIQEYLLWLADDREVSIADARILHRAAGMVGPYVNGRNQPRNY